MGLSMDRQSYELHVPSGPTSSSQNGAPLENLTLPQLIIRKDNLEAELKALGSVLDSHGVNMNTTLTTFDGYPRNDVDVAQIRVTRARIISLRNDWKEIMAKIEKGLHQQFEDLKKNGNVETAPAVAAGPSAVDTSAQSAPETPFAKVNSVEHGSPAHEAGLKAEDRIRSFGGTNWMNHERLRKVGEVVQRNLGRQILVKVVRGTGNDAQELQLRVTPRQGWGGRGTLGCHILPI
jgi:26S proteasome regulatory subunit N4